MFLYVSLDNSVRSNKAGHPLYTRLDAICNVVTTIIEKNQEVVVFFSESCRPSFLLDANDMKQNVVSWLDMRKTICKLCGLTFLAEKRNNEDPSGMSFGVSAFERCSKIDTYFSRNILSEGFGSVALGVKLNTGSICWGIHFPLDFRGQASDNLGYKAMVGLQNVFEEYNGSYCALGDFNTIAGNIENAILNALKPSFELIGGDVYTFFGGYYDTIQEQNWEPLLATEK